MAGHVVVTQIVPNMLLQELTVVTKQKYANLLKPRFQKVFFAPRPAGRFRGATIVAKPKSIYYKIFTLYSKQWPAKAVRTLVS